jgi:hypothetical protein
MTLFDFGANLQIDLEKLEGIRLDNSMGAPIIYAIGMSGNEYMCPLGHENEFFEKLKQLERTSEISNQIVSL